MSRGLRSLRQFGSEIRRPRGVGRDSDISYAAQPRLDLSAKAMRDLRVDGELHAEHQLFPFAVRLHALGRELGLRRYKGNLGGEDVLGRGVHDEARLPTDREPAGASGWE